MFISIPPFWYILDKNLLLKETYILAHELDRSNQSQMGKFDREVYQFLRHKAQFSIALYPTYCSHEFLAFLISNWNMSR